MGRHAHTAPPGAAPWERQSREGPMAWQAFQVYRDMGPERTLIKTAETLGKSYRQISDYSMNHHWSDRVAAWEREQDRVMQKEQMAAIKKMRKRHADLATAALAKTAKALARIPEDDFKAADIARLMDVASRLERISRGDVGEVIEEREGEAMPPLVTFYMPDNSRD